VSAFLTLWRKELMGYFLSPIAYVMAVFFLFVMGVIFFMLATVLTSGPAGVTAMNLLFGSPFFWMTMFVVVPVLTMRLFADERRSGTIETLLTAPVSDAAVVLAKFAGAVSFYVFLWLPTVLYVFILKEFSSVMGPVDLGPMLGGYAAALLIGVFYLSVGLLCSAVTSNQIVAAISSFALIIVAFLVGFLEYISRNDAVRHIGTYVSSYSHMMDFSRGAFDTRPVVFYVTCTALCLFATVKVIESRQWK
jgi:ABC-2 type transport system permease protein